VARMTVFGRRTDERAADAEEHAEEARAEARTEERIADERGAEERREDRPPADRSLAERMRIRTNRGVATVERPTAPVTAVAPTVAERGWHGRTSGLAVFGLMLALTAVYAALSGRLAPVAVIVGVLGIMFSGTAMSATTRPGVTGRGVAVLGLLGSILGIVFGILAMNGTVSWLNSDVDQVAQLRDWLNNHVEWLRRW
jgi:hypothetical protein